MARIGEYRIKTYELLKNKPICQYAENSNGIKEMNVLILGNGWAGNEAFKAAFWAGQYIDSKLNITVASKNAIEYREKVLSNDKNATLPALIKFIEEKNYATLNFKNINLSNECELSGLRDLELEKNKYNYIIVALGDAEHNWLVASELASHIQLAQESGSVVYSGKIIINIFDEFSNRLDNDVQEMLVRDFADCGIEINFFGNESQLDLVELERVAKNLNFSYALKYNQRTNKTSADKDFNKSKKNEFEESPYDYETGDLDIVRNFIGSNYAADSSFASAVHIPYKLYLCQEFSKSDPLETLIEAIKTKNVLYYKLIALEHRRWNAYMVMRGFRAPSVQEEEKYLFKEIDGRLNTHQDKGNLLHICMCDCFDESSQLENDFSNKYQLWINNKLGKDTISELDRSSLRCHQLTSELSKKIIPKDLFDNIVGENNEYINLRKSIQKLINDDENSVNLYDRSLKEAKSFAKQISEEELQKIELVEKELFVVKARNSRTNFISLDAQLIEMIPFSLWYEEKYQTTIIVTDGVPVNDVIIPTLLNAKEAIFVSGKSKSKNYQNVIKSYFKSRNSEISIGFFGFRANEVKIIYEELDKLVNKYGLENIVVSLSSIKNNSVVLAIGSLMEKYSGKLSVVQYDHQKGIMSFGDDKCFEVGLEDKSFSVNEYIELMGGRIQNEYGTLYDSASYDILVELFKNHSETIFHQSVQENGKVKNISFVPWIVAAKFFSQNAKNEDKESMLLSQKVTDYTLKNYKGIFAADVYNESEIGKFVCSLSNYKIIGNVSEITDNGAVTLSFDYYDIEISQLLLPFEQCTDDPNVKNKRIRFTAYSGIKIVNLSIENADISKDDPHDVITNSKISLLKEMHQKGFIKNLSVNDNLVSFAFKDEATMDLFKKQGQSFELVLYHLMKESGFFNEVETGTKISWSAKDKTFEEAIIEKIRESRERIIGYRQFNKIRELVKYNPSLRGNKPENELDIIAICGMNPVFVSCKTGKDNKIEWIYEISSLSTRFNSTGVMAISNDFSNKNTIEFSQRAYQTGISLLGTETLWDQKKLSEAFSEIINKRTYRYDK